MKSAEKREHAKICLEYALESDFKNAAHIRQRIYAVDPPGTIGIDWNDWNDIWRRDLNYLTFLHNEDFSDLQNTNEYINIFKSALYVDYLWGFRDWWGIAQIKNYTDEKMFCPLLEKFLVNKNLYYDTVSRECLYERTKRRNISSKQYYAACQNDEYKPSYQPKIYDYGEYDLGYYSDPTSKELKSLHNTYYEFDLFKKMSTCKIEKFPKTLQTFQKHRRNKSEKYKYWLEEYQIWLWKNLNPNSYIYTRWGIYEMPNPYTIKADYGPREDTRKVL